MTPRVLRVLFINDTSRNGGPGRTLVNILKHIDSSLVYRVVVLPREGLVFDLLRQSNAYEEVVIEPGILENPFEPLSRPIERTDLSASVALKSLRFSGNVFRASRGLARLLRVIRNARIDLIFCNGTSACFLGAFFGMVTKVPVLWHVFYSQVAGPLRTLHRRLAASNAVASIVCVSACTTKQFEHCRSKVQVIHDSIDTNEFAPLDPTPTSLRDELGLAPDMMIFGSHGRILPKKGYVELLRAFDAFLASLSSRDRTKAHLVVIGDTPDDAKVDHLAECKQLTSALGITKNVHFLGFRTDINRIVAGLDVVVVPSVYEDPLPRAVMEAMAMAKPVIAYAVGGIPEMIEHEENGLLVPPSEPLHPALLRYFTNRDMALAHGKAARIRTLSLFSAPGHALSLTGAMLRASQGS